MPFRSRHALDSLRMLAMIPYYSLGVYDRMGITKHM